MQIPPSELNIGVYTIDFSIKIHTFNVQVLMMFKFTNLSHKFPRFTSKHLQCKNSP